MDIKNLDPEFINITKDIMDNEEYNKIKDIKHHGNGLYEHSVNTAYLSYKIAKWLNADYVTATRAAMLHDFFYFDWRSEEAKAKKRGYRGINRLIKMHGFVHPFEACENASKYFILNERERDAIKKHMFPLVPLLPKYIESWIVTFADKVIASREMSVETKIVIKHFWIKERMLISVNRTKH